MRPGVRTDGAFSYRASIETIEPTVSCTVLSTRSHGTEATGWVNVKDALNKVDHVTSKR